MFLDWIEKTIATIEKAIFAVEDSLQRDDPSRANKTTYQYPREEYLAHCLTDAKQACRSVVLCCRLANTHLEDENTNTKLLSIDLETLAHQQQMWLRKLSEILCNIVNLDELGNEYFKLFLLRDKAKGRRNLSEEMQEIFGCQVQLLEIYCKNDEEAFENLKKMLPKSSITGWNAETSILNAFNGFTEAEKFIVGHYLNYRIRSGSIHFSTFPENLPTTDFNMLLYLLTMTTLLIQFILVRAARMFPIIHPEVAELSDSGMKDIFAQQFSDLLDPGIDVGDRVTAIVGSVEHEGTVNEIKTGKLGGKSYRIAPLQGQRKWSYSTDFHPAMFVRKHTT